MPRPQLSGGEPGRVRFPTWWSLPSTLSLAMMALLAPAAMAATPVTVSPGSPDTFTTVASSCPTFSWAGVPGASGYELAVLPVEGVGDEAVLEVALPAGARAWTPAADQCLAPGGRFSWAIRALVAERTGEWSADRLMEIGAGPTAKGMGLPEALEIVRRHLEATGSRAALPDLPVEGTAHDRLRGEPRAMPGSAEMVGGFAVRVSAEGIAVLAANLDPSGGADLVLDGGAQGGSDALWSQSGVDRPSAVPQTFELGNSEGAGMSLTVDGVDVVTSATDRDTLRDLVCGDGQIARYDANEARWVCSPPPT